MNTKLIRNILIALCLCCISCGNSSATSKEKEAITTEDVSRIVNDSIAKLSNEISVIKKDLQKDIEKLENGQKEKEKNQGNKWLIYTWLIALTGIIVWLVYCWNKTPEKKDFNRLVSEIDDIRKKMDALLRKQGQDVSKKYSNNRDNETYGPQIQQILERLLVVENTIKESSSPKKKVVEPVQDSVKEGYFGIVKGYGFFNEVYSSKRDESKFNVRFMNNDKEAEFDLIDLRRIKSFDGIEKAVYFDTSEASLQEATSYETINRGLAIKDGNIWEIKQKVSVRLKK